MDSLYRLAAETEGALKRTLPLDQTVWRDLDQSEKRHILETTLERIMAARRNNVDSRGRWRAGMALVARGEFSIVIAGLGAGIEPQLGPLSAAYVLFMAILGPLLARAAR